MMSRTASAGALGPDEVNHFADSAFAAGHRGGDRFAVTGELFALLGRDGETRAKRLQGFERAEYT